MLKPTNGKTARRRQLPITAVVSTLIAAGAAVSLALWHKDTRIFLRRLDDASDIIAGTGLRGYVHTALSCVAAFVAVCSVSLSASFLSILFQACSTSSSSISRLLSRLIVLLALFASILSCAVLAAITTSMVAAKLASLASGLGGRLASEVVSISQRADPLASKLGLVATRNPPADASSTCDAHSCFNAARFPFLRSSACICGTPMLVFHAQLQDAFSYSLRAVVAGAVLFCTLLILFGLAVSSTTAFTALASSASARRISNGAAEKQSLSGSDEACNSVAVGRDERRSRPPRRRKSEDLEQAAGRGATVVSHGRVGGPLHHGRTFSL